MTKPKKDPPPSKEERDLDEALEESFPASDPPSHEDPDKNLDKKPER